MAALPAALSSSQPARGTKERRYKGVAKIVTGRSALHGNTIVVCMYLCMYVLYQHRQAFSNIKILESHSSLKPIFCGLEQVRMHACMHTCIYKLHIYTYKLHTVYIHKYTYVQGYIYAYIHTYILGFIHTLHYTHPYFFGVPLWWLCGRRSRTTSTSSGVGGRRCCLSSPWMMRAS